MTMADLPRRTLTPGGPRLSSSQQLGRAIQEANGISIELRRKPHAQQLKFVAAGEPEQLYGGAKRGGKSVALGQKIILLSMAFPGNRGLLARKDFTDLQDTTLAEFFQTCPPELIAEHNKTERRVTFINGSIMLYRGLGSLDDIEKAKGLNLGWLAIDEPSEIQFETYLMLRAQLTWILPTGAKPPYMCMLGCNPEPGWVKQRFITEPQPGCVFIPALPRDNPFLPDGWEQMLVDAGYPKEWIEKYLMGSWDVAEGQVFPELGQPHYIDTPAPEFIQSLTLVVAIDHATTGITAATLNGFDAYDNMFTLDEYYQANRLVSEHAAEILFMIHRHTKPLNDKTPAKRLAMTLIDPSTTAKTLQGHEQLQSVNELYREYGINATPAWNALEMGIGWLKERMKVDMRHPHPLHRQPDGQPIVGSPRYFIVKKSCKNTIKEMHELKKEVTDSGRIKYVGKDHGLDTVRYVSNARPRRPNLPPSVNDFRDSMERKAYIAHQSWAKKFDRSISGGNQWWGHA